MEFKQTAELSFLRAPFPVDLVETGLRQKNSVLCVAKENSKIFIAVKLVQEVKRRSFPGKATVVLSENVKSSFVEEFSRAVDLQTDLRRTTVQNAKNETISNVDSLDADLLVATAQDFLYLLNSNSLSVEKIRLVIIDNCLINDHHEVSYGIQSFTSVLDFLRSHDLMLQPIIIGLCSDLPVSSPDELTSKLTATEVAFGCHCSVSSDLVAMNRFGEQPKEKLITCSILVDETNEKVKEVSAILMNVYGNLMVIDEESQLVSIKQQSLLCHKILGCFGLCAAIYHARLIIKQISKLKKKLKNDLEKPYLSSCETELKAVLQFSKKDEIPDITSLVENITSSLSYLKPKSILDAKSTLSSTNDEHIDTASSVKVANNTYHGYHGDNPASLILCSSDQEAMVLNFLLNKLAKTTPKLAYLHTRHISSGMIKQNDMDIDTDEEKNEDIVRLIHEGQVNVVVTGQEVEKDIYLGQCKQVIRIGIPQDYESYVQVKKIPRMECAEFIILELEENNGKDGMLRYNAFKEVEGILTTRCSSHQTVVESEADISLDVANYEPHGKDAPCVEAKHAVALINRYCKAFPSDGVSIPLLCCREKVIEEKDQTHVISKLYLPRHSPVFWPFEGTATIPRKNTKGKPSPDELGKARIESKTRAALLACKALLDVDEMNDQLEPTTRHDNVTFKKADEKCASEVADGGQGVEGKAKRRRAYQKKFATILTNNLAVAGEPVYVYGISVAVNQLYNRLGMVRSYHVPSAEVSNISLGFLSRNRLPKLPSFLLYNRAGELKISIIECQGRTVLTPDQLSLVQRFHQYVHTHIIGIDGDSEEQCFQFDPKEQTFGCYLVLLTEKSVESQPRNVGCSGDLKNGLVCDDGLQEVDLQKLSLQNREKSTENKDKAKELATEASRNAFRENAPNIEERAVNLKVAFDFLEETEEQLGDFRKPQLPPKTETNNYEIFRDRVVTAAYMAKPTNYFVADVCYDMTPSSPFPNTSVAATFVEYYKQKYDIEVHENQPLLSVDHISKTLDLLSSRYQDIKGKDLLLPDKNSKRRQRSQINLIPQLCSIHPISAPLWQEILCMPSIMYRVECLLAAEELRQSIALQTGIGSVEYSGTELPLLATGESVGENITVGLFQEKNDELSKKKQTEGLQDLPRPSPTLVLGENSTENLSKENISDRFKKEQIERPEDQPGPSTTLFLRALTCLGACDVFSHERLEMFGDALIKHSVSLNLHREFPFSNVGQISFLKGIRVSNRQLFYLGRALDLPSYILNVPFTPLANWHPHGFKALSSAKTKGRYLELNAADQGVDLSDNEDEAEESACAKRPSAVSIDGQNHVVASDKTVADTTEAIIGAYLVTCRFDDALKVMKWIGLDVRTKDTLPSPSKADPLSKYLQDQEKFDFEEEFFDNSPLLKNESLDVEFKEIEEVLKYTFRDKLLLLQAFTHATYPRDLNHVLTSYEHLEFLGDALLDYLITRYLYYTQRTMTPGALTDFRSAVVNSYSFAFLAVKYGFHRHLRSLSPAAYRLVNKFVVIQDEMMKKKIKENPSQIFSSVFIPMDEEDGEQEGIEVPKVLADLFESVIGAVFIDCGQDEERTWAVVYPLLQATLEHYSAHLPMSALRKLQEMMPNALSLVSLDRDIAGKYACTILVEGVGKFKGTGRNPKIARSTAAQRALAHIQAQSGKKPTNNT